MGIAGWHAPEEETLELATRMGKCEVLEALRGRLQRPTIFNRYHWNPLAGGQVVFLGTATEVTIRVTIRQSDRNPYRPEFVGRCLSPSAGPTLLGGVIGYPAAWFMRAYLALVSLFLPIGLMVLALGSAPLPGRALFVAIPIGLLVMGAVLHLYFGQQAGIQAEEIKRFIKDVLTPL